MLSLRLVRTLLGLCAVAALIGSACGDTGRDVISAASSDGDDVGLAQAENVTDAVDDSVSLAVEPEAPRAAPDSGGDRALGGSGTTAQVDPATLGRDIIYTADLTIAVDDVTAAGAQAAQIVGAKGGLLFGQETQASPVAEDGRPRGATSRLTFRVEPSVFQEVLGGLSALGDVRAQTVSTEDVTGRVVDLESRISTAEISVERIRDLLGGAGDVETLTVLEQQLLERETTLELLRGQLRQVRDQVDLATIHVTLTEALAQPDVELGTSVYAGHGDGGIGCPGNESSIDAGEDITLCFEVINTGDSPLAQIAITDTVLDIDESALTVVYGDPTTELLPGQSVIWSYETNADRTLRLRTRVTASPVNVDGTPIDARAVQIDRERVISVWDADDVPTFGEAVAGGWRVLKTLGQVLLVVLGALLPFIWVIPLIWLARRWFTSRKARRTVEPSVADTPAQAAPPPPSRTDASGPDPTTEA